MILKGGYDVAKQLSMAQVAAVVEGLVGIEVEMHRVTSTGQLSQYDYPATLADQREHHFIKNDFLQTQSELITPAIVSTRDVVTSLGMYQQALRSALQPDERLWPYSMPPQLRGDHSDIEIAQTDLEGYHYRQRVAELRKIERTAETGVHINLGLTDEGLQALSVADDKDASNTRYLRAAVGFYRYRWLLTYLFGATPVAFSHYFSDGVQGPKRAVRSLRNSQFGFGNGIPGRYSSVAAYVKQIQDAVAAGDLIAEREYYGIVRLKGGADLAELAQKGIHYIELRTLDLNPFEPLGISVDALNFVRLMFAYFVLQGEDPTVEVDAEINAAEAKNETVALESPLAPTVYLNEGLAFIDELQRFCRRLTLPLNVQTVCLKMRERLLNPALTPSARLVTMSHGTGMSDTLLSLTNAFHDDMLSRPLIGFEVLSQASRIDALKAIRQGETWRETWH